MRASIGIAAALAALVVTTLATAAQGIPWRLVQAGDGSLHVIADGVRHRIVPAPIADAELAAIPKGEASGANFAAASPPPAAVQPPPQAEPPAPPEPGFRVLATGWGRGARCTLSPRREGGMMADWGGIEYDQKGQVEQILPWILDHERLYAVYDCKGGGTGFVGITDKRVIFYDREFMRKRKALTSIPFNKITSVSSIDEGRSLWGSTSSLVLKTGSEEYEFEFRGGDKAQRAYRFIMAHLL